MASRRRTTRGGASNTSSAAPVTLAGSQPPPQFPSSTSDVLLPPSQPASSQVAANGIEEEARHAAPVGDHPDVPVLTPADSLLTNGFSQQTAMPSKEPRQSVGGGAKGARARSRRRKTMELYSDEDDEDDESLHLTDTSDTDTRKSRRVTGVAFNGVLEQEAETDYQQPAPPTSVVDRLWRMVASSPRWIRETGRGSDSETDSDDEVIITNYADRRRSQSSPYWLREAVKGPERLRFVEGERRRRQVVKRVVQPDGHYEDVVVSEDDTDAVSSDPDAGDDGDDGAWRSNKGMLVGPGFGANGRRRRRRSAPRRDKTRLAGGLLSAEEDELEDDDQGDDDQGDETFAIDGQQQDFGGVDDYPALGMDDIPTGHHLTRHATASPGVRTHWQAARRWFKLYVRRPSRRLSRWFFAQLVFILFCVYWSVKEAVKVTIGFAVVWPAQLLYLAAVRKFGVRGTYSAAATAAALILIIIAWDSSSTAGRILHSVGNWFSPRNWVRAPSGNFGDYMPKFSFPMPSSHSISGNAEEELRLRLDALNNHMQQLSAGVIGFSQKQGESESRVGKVEDRLGSAMHDLEERVRQTEESLIRVRLELANQAGSGGKGGDMGAGSIYDGLTAMQSELKLLAENYKALKAQTTASHNGRDALSDGTIPDEMIVKVMELLAARKDSLPKLIEETVRRQVDLVLTQAVHSGRVLDLSSMRNELVRADMSSGRSGLDISRAEEHKLRMVIRAEMARARADDIAVVDYAQHAGGALVLSGMTSPTFQPSPRGFLSKIWNAWMPGIFNPAPGAVRGPETALTPSQQLGDCWPVQIPAVEGGYAKLTVRLARSIAVDAFTLEHVDVRVALDIGFSPRSVELWAIAEPDSKESPPPGWETDTDTGRWVRRIAAAEYQVDREARGFVAPVQTYWVEDAARGIVTRTVQLRVKSNWGRNDGVVCLYRLRVHGREAGAVPETAVEG